MNFRNRAAMPVCLAGLVALLAIGAACDQRGQRAPEQRGSDQRGAAAKVETVQLTSTFLERAEYDAANRALTIYFDDGSSYRYADVPSDVFAALRTNAAQPVDVFRKSIRTSFKYTKLTSATKKVTHTRTRKPKPPKPAPRVVDVACAPLNQVKRQAVVSDAFRSVAYDPPTKCLVVEFNRRGTYAYGNVPEAVYRRLVTRGDDPGVYFNRNVRGKYDAKRLTN